MKKELQAAKTASDDAQGQIVKLKAERDKALMQAENDQAAVRRLTLQLSEQTSKVSTIESQIGGLQRTIETQKQAIEQHLMTIGQQQATIEQLKKTIEGLPKAPEPNAVRVGQ